MAFHAIEQINANELDLKDRVVHINRVAKVVKGGRRFSFSALVVVGDGAGIVGVGLGKAGEVPEAIRKGVERARKSLIRVPLVKRERSRTASSGATARAAVLHAAASSAGTGVIAGGGVRAVARVGGRARRSDQDARNEQPAQRGARHHGGPAGTCATRRAAAPPGAPGRMSEKQGLGEAREEPDRLQPAGSARRCAGSACAACNTRSSRSRMARPCAA